MWGEELVYCSWEGKEGRELEEGCCRGRRRGREREYWVLLWAGQLQVRIRSTGKTAGVEARVLFPTLCLHPVHAIITYMDIDVYGSVLFRGRCVALWKVKMQGWYDFLQFRKKKKKSSLSELIFEDLEI